MPPLPPTKKQNNPKITIDEKVTLKYPPSPDASTAAPNNYFIIIPGSTVSKFLYSLMNCNYYFKIAPDTKKQEFVLIDAHNTDEPGADDDYASDSPNAADDDDGSKDS